MKKRLLSAFLALAMVLTLLPATAFAVDWTTDSGDHSPEHATYPTSATDPTTKDYYVKDGNGRVTSTVTVTRCTAADPKTGQEYGKWYWQDNRGGHSQTPVYKEVQSGIVTGTSGSGQWYASVADYTNNNVTTGDKVRGAFTALGESASIDLSRYTDTSLTLAIAGNAGTLTIPATLTTLNITAPFQKTPGGVVNRGVVSAITTNRGTQVTGGTNTGLTVTANNIEFGSITLNGRANTLRLTDCAVTGDISMDGATITTVGGSTPNSWGAQTINATNSTFGATITISNSNGGGITFQDSKMTGGTNAVSFTSDGGSIRVSGASALGVITVAPRTVNGSYATVNISGGSVLGVTQDNSAVSANDKALSVTVTGANTRFGDINTGVNGTVNITDADGTSVTVDKGTLTIGGSGVNITGDVTVGADDKTTLNMRATGSSFGGIKAVATKGANVIIGAWEGKRQIQGGNDYGVLDLKDYKGKKVTGGTFSGAKTIIDTFVAETCLPWLDTANLQFVTTSGTTTFDLYTKDELARAISDIGTTAALQTWGITVLGQGGTSEEGGRTDLTLKTGQNPVAKIGYNSTTPLILPEKINNMTISTWFTETNRNVSFPSGSTVNIPYQAGGLTLNATGTSTAVNRITKARASTPVASTDGKPVVNQNVTVTLNGNTIHVTGAVTPNAGGVATVRVDLDTDVVDEDGNYITLEGVRLDYNVNTKVISFNSILPEEVLDAGALVQDGLLVLNHGTGEKYSVTANLNESASSLGIAPDTAVENSIVVTFGGKLSSMTTAQKNDLTELLSGTNTSFTYGANQAMQQAINAAQATITNNTNVESWVTNAKNTIWRQGFKSPNTALNENYGYVANMAPHTGNFNSATTDGGVIADAFQKAYIVPYLVVNVTDYDAAGGTLSATLTPYYRVDVSGASYVADKAYTVQQGRALTLTGDITSPNAANQVKVKFNLGAKFETQYMHQDGKYVYQGVGGQWMISHIGANGGLGSIVINGSDGLVKLGPTVTGGPAAIDPRVPALTSLNCKYDTLQAAIDDTVRGTIIQTTGDVTGVSTETMDTVTIDGKYTGSGAVNMTGIARKVYVAAEGQQDVTSNTGNVSVQTQGGYRYLVELKQDNVAAGTVAIAVTSTGNGTLSANRSTAKPGDTVTITTIPTAGQAVSSISAKTNSGANVSITSTGVANQYRFTVPQNATSVTVTASFGVATAANLTITSSNYGLAATSSTQVYAGQEVTITTTPYTGYRATGVTVTTNAGTMTATRTADNVYKFTVPANATYVTVTPNFAADTGLPFVDVPANDFYLDAVKFVYEKGLMNGITATTFGGSRTITRGQIVTILYRLSGNPSTSNTSSFQDVPADEYYAPAITWAASNAIVNGRSSTTFAPNDAITRQELAAILYRYTSFRGLTNSKLANLSGYTDQGQVDGYAVTPMQWCVGNGIINGTSNTTLTPRGTAQRYQAAIMLMRYCQAFLNM